MYIVPTDIPQDVAMSVWRITHNEATSSDWHLLDRHPRKTILGWITKIYEANDTVFSRGEVQWWQTQLTIPDN